MDLSLFTDEVAFEIATVVDEIARVQCRIKKYNNICERKPITCESFLETVVSSKQLMDSPWKKLYYTSHLLEDEPLPSLPTEEEYYNSLLIDAKQEAEIAPLEEYLLRIEVMQPDPLKQTAKTGPSKVMKAYPLKQTAKLGLSKKFKRKQVTSAKINSPEINLNIDKGQREKFGSEREKISLSSLNRQFNIFDVIKAAKRCFTAKDLQKLYQATQNIKSLPNDNRYQMRPFELSAAKTIEEYFERPPIVKQIQVKKSKAVNAELKNVFEVANFLVGNTILQADIIIKNWLKEETKHMTMIKDIENQVKTARHKYRTKRSGTKLKFSPKPRIGQAGMKNLSGLPSKAIQQKKFASMETVWQPKQKYESKEFIAQLTESLTDIRSKGKQGAKSDSSKVPSEALMRLSILTNTEMNSLLELLKSHGITSESNIANISESEVLKILKDAGSNYPLPQKYQPMKMSEQPTKYQSTLPMAGAKTDTSGKNVNFEEKPHSSVQNKGSPREITDFSRIPPEALPRLSVLTESEMNDLIEILKSRGISSKNDISNISEADVLKILTETDVNYSPSKSANGVQNKDNQEAITDTSKIPSEALMRLSILRLSEMKILLELLKSRGISSENDIANISEADVLKILQETHINNPPPNTQTTLPIKGAVTDSPGLSMNNNKSRKNRVNNAQHRYKSKRSSSSPESQTDIRNKGSQGAINDSSKIPSEALMRLSLLPQSERENLLEILKARGISSENDIANISEADMLKILKEYHINNPLLRGNKFRRPSTSAKSKVDYLLKDSKNVKTDLFEMYSENRREKFLENLKSSPEIPFQSDPADAQIWTVSNIAYINYQLPELPYISSSEVKSKDDLLMKDSQGATTDYPGTYSNIIKKTVIENLEPNQDILSQSGTLNTKIGKLKEKGLDIDDLNYFTSELSYVSAPDTKNIVENLKTHQQIPPESDVSNNNIWEFTEKDLDVDNSNYLKVETQNGLLKKNNQDAITISSEMLSNAIKETQSGLLKKNNEDVITISSEMLSNAIMELKFDIPPDGSLIEDMARFEKDLLFDKETEMDIFTDDDFIRVSLLYASTMVWLLVYIFRKIMLQFKRK